MKSHAKVILDQVYKRLEDGSVETLLDKANLHPKFESNEEVIQALLLVESETLFVSRLLSVPTEKFVHVCVKSREKRKDKNWRGVAYLTVSWTEVGDMMTPFTLDLDDGPQPIYEKERVPKYVEAAFAEWKKNDYHGLLFPDCVVKNF